MHSNRQNIFNSTATLATIFFLVAAPAWGGDMDHKAAMQPGSMQQHGTMQHGSEGAAAGTKAAMFLERREIDGYTVSFHVMQPKAGMGHGGSHNLMVKVERANKLLDNIVINSKVIHPNGKSESKMLKKMGSWYMAGYDLGHSGRHQLMVLFKTADGNKHKGGVYYPGGAQ